ncbi:MAG: ATP-binding protein [Bacteroidetes bacterium]|nr:ATP-binding protein [Bacteroidota bacterium]MBU1578171.1 ATP-binding protein [Bacteroidota bacterium]MBU2466814.1 ATP-binding protein [Bacteroidota bacterium]
MINTRPYSIAVASGKGGTGKTLVATNLADYLARSQPVLLADLDVEEPNDALFFKAENQETEIHYKMIPDWQSDRCSLCGDCSRHCKFHAVVQLGEFITVFNELCHSCYACSDLCHENALPMKANRMGITNSFTSGQIQLLESRLDIGQEQAVPLIHATQKRLQKTDPNIRLHILDCPPGTSCPVVAAVEQADFVLLVTEPTPFGLNDLRLAAKTMQQLGKAFAVVINRDGTGNQEVETWCSQQQITIAVRIPYDREIAENYAAGKIAWKRIPVLEKALEKLSVFIQLKQVSDA